MWGGATCAESTVLHTSNIKSSAECGDLHRKVCDSFKRLNSLLQVLTSVSLQQLNLRLV
ncbi:hypothetical protein Plhal304r1_c007g0030141 [Plasmopara halstedii]